MCSMLEKFPDKETFDLYWKENYTPLQYEDVKEAFESFVKEAEQHIFSSDYEQAGAVSKEDFISNLSQTAEFTFQDALTEAFYDKNPDVYESAFAIFEEAQMEGKSDTNIAQTFHEEYQRLYQAFLNEMFDVMFL